MAQAKLKKPKVSTVQGGQLEKEDKVVRSMNGSTETKKKKGRNPFLTTSFSETIAEAKAMEVPRMLFSEFIFETDLTILFSSAGVGKTMLAVQIADSISRGVSIDGFTNETKPQKVLYLDFELSKKQFEGRYCERDVEDNNIWFNHYDFNQNIYRVVFDKKNAGHLTVEDIMYGIVEEVKHKDAKIIFIDNITWINATGLENSKDAGRLMKALIDLKSSEGLTLIILAHTPKKFKWSSMELIDLAGSAQLGNFCDSVFAINYSRENESYRYLKQVKCRFAELKYHSGNVVPVELKRIERNFIGIETLPFDEFNILEKSHLESKVETVEYTEESREKKKKNIEELVKENPKLSARKLANETGVGKTTCAKRKKEFLTEQKRLDL